MLTRLYYKNVKPIYLINKYGDVFSEYLNDFMKPKADKDGYLELSLRANDESTIFVRVATLVAYNFIGPPPEYMDDPTVDHIDNNVLNNYYKNLRWLPRSLNSSIRQNKGAGESNHEAILTDKKVIEICDLLIENKLSLREIANIYGVDKSTISNIRRKVNWKHISELYSFPTITISRNENGKYIKNIN